MYGIIKPEQISPWYCSPEICRDWIRVAGDRTKVPRVMVKKREEGGNGKMKNVIVPYEGGTA